MHVTSAIELASSAESEQELHYGTACKVKGTAVCHMCNGLDIGSSQQSWPADFGKNADQVPPRAQCSHYMPCGTVQCEHRGSCHDKSKPP
jgi:hypothetical protein